MLRQTRDHHPDKVAKLEWGFWPKRRTPSQETIPDWYATAVVAMSITSSIAQQVKWFIFATTSPWMKGANSFRVSTSKCTMTVDKKKRPSGYDTTPRTRCPLMVWRKLSSNLSSIIGATCWELLDWTPKSPSSCCKTEQRRFRPFTKEGLQSVSMQPELSSAKWGHTEEVRIWCVCKKRALSFSERRQRWIE